MNHHQLLRCLRGFVASLFGRLQRMLSSLGGRPPIALSSLFPILDRLFVEIEAERSGRYEFEVFFGLVQIMVEIDASLFRPIVQRYFQYVASVETDLESVIEAQIQRRSLHAYQVQISSLQQQAYRNISAPIATEVQVPQERIWNRALLARNLQRWTSLKSLLRFTADFDEYPAEFEPALLSVFKELDFSTKSWYDAVFYMFDDLQFKSMIYGVGCQEQFLAFCLVIEQMTCRRPEFLDLIAAQYGLLILNRFNDDREIVENTVIVSLLSKLTARLITAAPDSLQSLRPHCYWFGKDQIRPTERWSR